MRSPAETAIIVYETNPFWGPELQRQFFNSPIAICECRAIVDLAQIAEPFRSGLFVVDLAADLAGTIHWLRQTQRTRTNRWPVIAIGSAETLTMEWNLREAGVTAYLPDFVGGDEFAKLCRRQLGL